MNRRGPSYNDCIIYHLLNTNEEMYIYLELCNNAKTTHNFSIGPLRKSPELHHTMSAKLLFSTIEVTGQAFYRSSLSYAIVNLKPIVPGRKIIDDKEPTFDSH